MTKGLYSLITRAHWQIFFFIECAGEAQTPSYVGSDIPDQDVDDNENAAPPPPSAPPAEMFGKFAGYESVSFGRCLR